MNGSEYLLWSHGQFEKMSFFPPDPLPSTTASSNPFQRGSRGWCTLVHQNHADGGENGSIMVGIIVSLCLASKKPSEKKFFVPTGTDLAVKLSSVNPIFDLAKFI